MAIHFESTPVKLLLPAIPLALSLAVAASHDTPAPAPQQEVRCLAEGCTDPLPPPPCGADGYRCAVAPA